MEDGRTLFTSPFNQRFHEGYETMKEFQKQIIISVLTGCGVQTPIGIVTWSLWELTSKATFQDTGYCFLDLPLAKQENTMWESSGFLCLGLFIIVTLTLLLVIYV